MNKDKLYECPLIGGDIPGLREANTTEEKIKVLWEYYWTLEMMASEAQSVIQNRIKELERALGQTAA